MRWASLRSVNRSDGRVSGLAEIPPLQEREDVNIQSRTPAGKELARQVLAVFKAWEDGKLVAADEAAQRSGAAYSAKTPTANRQWPGHYSIEHSRFLTAGPPAAIPSGFIASVRKDNRFTRIETTLDLTITVTEDQVRVFDVDLGHAIGGQCTNKVRPRVRELQATAKAVHPLVQEIAEIALLCRSLPNGGAMKGLHDELREIRSLIEANVAAGQAAETQGVVSRLTGLLGRLTKGG